MYRLRVLCIRMPLRHLEFDSQCGISVFFDRKHEEIYMSDITAVMETSKGTIRLHLFADKTPVTCGNFINLAGLGFYNGLKFHRVIADFMIQGGCPYGNGMGGPGYNFEDEFHKSLKHDRAGILSMANAGPKTNGSQFFITHGPTPHLDGAHTVFGAVVSDDDQKVVDSIAQGDTIEKVTIEGDTAAVLEKLADRIKAWDEKVTKIFPKLSKGK